MEHTVRLITPAERTEGSPTPGMTRQQAVSTDHLWAGVAHTDAGTASGWHHHGEYESTIFVVSGALRMEFGPGGGESFDAGPGDFVYVPPQVVHRELNPAHERSEIVVARSGRGEPVFNVDGPDPA